MKIRLALVERDVNVLHHKYNVLSTRPVDSVPGAALAVSDMHLFTISSLADLQVDRLRLKLALQDNPDDVSRSFSMLNSKIDRHETSSQQVNAGRKRRTSNRLVRFARIASTIFD